MKTSLIYRMHPTLLVLALALSAAGLAGCAKEQPATPKVPTAPPSISPTQAPPRANPAAPERAPAEAAAPRVATVVFLDKAACCECTKTRQDATWTALSEALAKRDGVEVQRIHLDTEAPRAKAYLDQRPTMVTPGLYFLDSAGALVEHRQGELSAAQIEAALGGGTAR
jgi:hypothetical protein